MKVAIVSSLNNNHTLSMEINKSLKVEVTKTLPAAAEQVYNAWTEPEQLKKWWKPMGNSLKEVTNDIRKGGTVRYIFDNNKLIISGEYLEVEEKQKLVYIWKWELPNDAVRNAEYKLTVSFISKDNGSEIYVLQENFKDEETMLPHQEGWEKGLADFANFLNGSNTITASQLNEGGVSDETGEGYRENPEQVKVGGG